MSDFDPSPPSPPPLMTLRIGPKRPARPAWAGTGLRVNHPGPGATPALAGTPLNRARAA